MWIVVCFVLLFLFASINWPVMLPYIQNKLSQLVMWFLYTIGLTLTYRCGDVIPINIQSWNYHCRRKLTMIDRSVRYNTTKDQECIMCRGDISPDHRKVAYQTGCKCYPCHYKYDVYGFYHKVFFLLSSMEIGSVSDVCGIIMTNILSIPRKEWVISGPGYSDEILFHLMEYPY